MEYAKIENERLIKSVVFPNGTAVLNGRLKRKATHEDFLSAGYLPIEETAEPENKDGFVKTSKWVQTDAAIVKKWTMKRDMRPLSESEVSRMLITEQINTLAVDDNTALRMREFYPAWESGKAYTVGYKVQYKERLYRVVQAHTSQDGWTPEAAPALWEGINETYAGTIDDPIPYDGNMTLTAGLYYMQYGEIYRCTRDTGIPVYHPLAELVGVYVEIV